METGQIAGVYAEVSGFPTPVSAHVKVEELPEYRVYSVTADWSQSDLVRGSRLHYSQQWTLIADTNNHKTVRTVLPPGPFTPVSGELLRAFSPIRGLKAIVRESGNQQLLEIWDCHGLRKCLNLTALNIHGRVYDDAQFGSLSWSECEDKLLYVAEKSRNSSAGGESACREDRNVYCEDWGEALTSKSVPVVCVVDLHSGVVDVLQGVPEDVSPGQALWAPDYQSVFFVGWYHEPFRLGLKFCSNRSSSLFVLDMEGRCERLSGANLSVSCPRLSPDGSTLIFLQGRVFGPHHQCLSLQQLDLKSRKTSALIDVLNRPQAGEFAGVYETLSPCCWSADSQRVVFSSACRNWKDLFVVDRKSKKVLSLSDTVPLSTLPAPRYPLFPPPPPPPPPPFPAPSLASESFLPPPPLPPPLSHLHQEQKTDVEDLSAASRDCGSWKLLTIQRDLMVVCCSSPNTPPTLRVGFLPEKSEAMTWQTLQQPAMTFDFSWTSLDIKPPPEEDNTQYPGLDFGSVLVKPSRPFCDSRIPLVVFIHGGPHSQFPAEWNSTTAGLVKLGCAVLMVNYRGSTGFGQDSILSLIGNIGSQDVKDVQRGVLAALWSDETLDPKRVAVIGGSHGGFLCCHLVGQYPDFYKACAARNPVINAATLLGTSDIVDWRYTSAGFQFSYDSVPTAEVLAALLQKSPITHAVQIKAAVLLMLGGKDRRVSPHQGLELYKVLKTRASPVRLLWFPEDGHSLSRVDTQADCFVNTALWLQQHL
ncbi:acylamino-acid-releasing enzyme isoform X1 [Oryzias latipes]|uniref:Acylamino-acid-releasing enzyme n=1 Tax=Oryzias latipes TaxID=8090 RepID=A0A3B3II73_ORYLA|nr:acylamino-acid-releasing enzyme isoform X1 [Oryzias latipes]